MYNRVRVRGFWLFKLSEKQCDEGGSVWRQEEMERWRGGAMVRVQAGTLLTSC